MARKTVLVSDISGAEIADGKGATVRITFHDARKGVRELDVTDEEAERMGGRQVARRGRRPQLAAPAAGTRGCPRVPAGYSPSQYSAGSPRCARKSRLPFASVAAILPLSRYSIRSGASSVDSISTRTGSSVRLTT